jgi:hypothetical protein
VGHDINIFIGYDVNKLEVQCCTIAGQKNFFTYNPVLGCSQAEAADLKGLSN